MQVIQFVLLPLKRIHVYYLLDDNLTVVLSDVLVGAGAVELLLAVMYPFTFQVQLLVLAIR